MSPSEARRPQPGGGGGGGDGEGGGGGGGGGGAPNSHKQIVLSPHGPVLVPALLYWKLEKTGADEPGEYVHKA